MSLTTTPSIRKKHENVPCLCSKCTAPFTTFRGRTILHESTSSESPIGGPRCILRCNGTTLDLFQTIQLPLNRKQTLGRSLAAAFLGLWQSSFIDMAFLSAKVLQLCFATVFNRSKYKPLALEIRIQVVLAGRPLTEGPLADGAGIPIPGCWPRNGWR